VLAVSLVLPPRSGRIPIGAFCVEQGRWRKRGGESAARFHSAQELLPQKAAKLALATPGRRRPAQRQLRQPLNTSVPAVAQRQLPVRQRILQRQGGASQQQRVWASVRKMQSKLSRNLKTVVTSDVSRSSLQLTLEHKKLAAARDGLIASLRDRVKGKDDVIGAVFAINGKINSGDVYPSHGLFLKMWPRLVSAAATEAIAEKSTKAAPKPAAMPVDKIAKFMQLAESGKTERKPLGAQLERETRVAKDKAIVMSTRRASGDFIHRSYVAY
jgi:hypothetical protein